MSRRRIYVNGKPQWADNEPGFVARPKGYGGSQLGWFTGVVVVPKSRRDGPSEVREREVRGG